MCLGKGMVNFVVEVN